MLSIALLMSALLVVPATSVKEVEFVSQSPTGMTFNFLTDLSSTVSGPEYYCFDVPAVSVLKGVSPSVTLAATETSHDHKLSDIQITFMPQQIAVGGIRDYSTFGGIVSGRYLPESAWDSSVYASCLSTTLNVPELTEPFEQICISNTCSATTGSCLDTNTFAGQLTVTGFDTQMELTPNPHSSSCGETSIGEIQYIASGYSSMVFNYQAVVDSETTGAVCEWFHPTYRKGDGVPTVDINMHFGQTEYIMSDFTLFFQYPDGTKKAISANETYGTSVATLPTWFDTYAVDTEQCYSATIPIPDVSAGFDQICIGNSCVGPDCIDSSQVYTGRVAISGFETKSKPIWYTSIQGVCGDDIYRPSYKPTETPPVTRGDVAAIILAGPIGLAAVIFFCWITITGFRSEFLFEIDYFFNFCGLCFRCQEKFWY
jgi:hypothetical protein